MDDHRLLKGGVVRARILDEARLKIQAFAKNNQPIGRLVSISIGDVPEVMVYVRGQAKTAEKLGIPFDQVHWPQTITQKACKEALLKFNDDPGIVGVILQRPVPSHIHLRSLQSAIHPLKDVEGMSPASIGNIVYNDVALAPCTAAAAVELIHETGLNMTGLEVVVIGHSEIVGKPIAMMLMACGATVTVCHHMTRSVAMHSRRADVVVVAVGKPGLIDGHMVRPGAAVVDIGINQITDSDGATKIVGDVDTSSVIQVASWVTPVPGGVGPVTTAVLMRNAVVAHQRQIDAGWL